MKKLKDFQLFTDENIDPIFVEYLRNLGFQVFDVKENNLFSASDIALLELATNNNFVVITLDSDFGTLIYKEKLAFKGIIYLKPGHFETSTHIQTFNSLIRVNPDLNEPFMIVGEWGATEIKIRINNSIVIL